MAEGDLVCKKNLHQLSPKVLFWNREKKEIRTKCAVQWRLVYFFTFFKMIFHRHNTTTTTTTTVLRPFVWDYPGEPVPE